MRGNQVSGARGARSAGMAAARRSFALHDRSARTGVPVSEIQGTLEAERAVYREAVRDADLGAARGHGGHTRREVLVGVGGLAATAALAGHPAGALARAPRTGRGQPRIAIVGAGLAGLRCAHLLWTRAPAAPVPTTVYEANPEPGRRAVLDAARLFFGGGLSTEHGGSFINSNQVAIRRLARRLRLDEEVSTAAIFRTGRRCSSSTGASTRYAEANADWHDIGYPAFRGRRRPDVNPGGRGAAGSRCRCRSGLQHARSARLAASAS